MPNYIPEARKAYKSKNIKLSKRAHASKKIHNHLQGEYDMTTGEYIGDFVYGALDGIITTFAVVAGVAGAALSSRVILIIGFANLLADGVSMALGNYLSTKSEKEFEEQERERELWEIENLPEREQEEIRQIYKLKGFKEPVLEKVVAVITKNKKVWVDTMMTEELHMFPQLRSPIKSGVVTFGAFVVASFFPLIPYVVGKNIGGDVNLFKYSIIITGVVLFVVGSLRTLVIGKTWWKAGLEMFIVGAIAATIAYFVGVLLGSIN